METNPWWNLVWNSRNRKHNIMAKWNDRQQQDRRYFKHFSWHLIVQFQLFPCQWFQTRIFDDLLNFQETLHVSEEIFNTIHEHPVDLHRCRISLLQHLIIVLHIINVSCEYITANIFPHLSWWPEGFLGNGFSICGFIFVGLRRGLVIGRPTTETDWECLLG